MLKKAVEDYIAIRRSVGFKLRDSERRLKSYASFAELRGEDHIQEQTVLEWSKQARSPDARYHCFNDVVRLARFLHAEDARHEITLANPYRCFCRRALPYIYSPSEIERII